VDAGVDFRVIRTNTESGAIFVFKATNRMAPVSIQLTFLFYPKRDRALNGWGFLTELSPFRPAQHPYSLVGTSLSVTRCRHRGPISSVTLSRLIPALAALIEVAAV